MTLCDASKAGQCCPEITGWRLRTEVGISRDARTRYSMFSRFSRCNSDVVAFRYLLDAL